VINFPTIPTASCPVLKAPSDTTPEYFYGCGIDAAWTRHPVALWEASRGGPRTQQLAELLQVIAVGGLVAWLAAHVRRFQPRIGERGGAPTTSSRVSSPEGV